MVLCVQYVVTPFIVRVQMCTFIHYCYDCYEYEYKMHFILYDTKKFDECFRLNCVLTEFTLNVGFKL